MANGKNTVVIYRDWKNIFIKLTDEEAGKLIKHLFRYINDEVDDDNPQCERLIEILFEPIKITLKRDLKHWESVIERRRESGKKGGIASGITRKQNEANEANALNSKQNEANEADSVTDSVTDSVKINKKSIDIVKIQNDFYQTIIPFKNSYPKEILRQFYDYWSEPNKSRTKIRYQLEKTWDVSKRLKRWASNDFNKRENGQSRTENQKPKITEKWD